MDPRARLMAIQTQINAWLNIMQEDSHFAVPEFMLEQIWNRLELVISVLNQDGVDIESNDSSNANG